MSRIEGEEYLINSWCSSLDVADCDYCGDRHHVDAVIRVEFPEDSTVYDFCHVECLKTFLEEQS